MSISYGCFVQSFPTGLMKASRWPPLHCKLFAQNPLLFTPTKPCEPPGSSVANCQSHAERNVGQTNLPERRVALTGLGRQRFRPLRSGCHIVGHDCSREIVVTGPVALRVQTDNSTTAGSNKRTILGFLRGKAGTRAFPSHQPQRGAAQRQQHPRRRLRNRLDRQITDKTKAIRRTQPLHHEQ